MKFRRDTTKTVLERFLDYVRFDTQSSEISGTHPSAPGELVFAKHLAAELKTLGARGVKVSKDSYVTACLPATPGLEQLPALGFIAHLDTSPEASGKDVKPSVVHYRGGVLPLGKSGLVLDPAVFPVLKRLAGKTLVVTDGTTLLGADDKAGIAILMAAADALAGNGLPHGRIALCFTPDEEIGEGTRGFDLKTFGAAAAYTVDGGDVAVFECENFNAAQAVFTVRGVSVHPGSAKGVMVNAIKVATEILAALPPDECPERTEGRQGFYHATGLEGTVAAAKLTLIVRDHDAASFAARRARLAALAAATAAKYGPGSVSLKLKDQYRNMAEVIAHHPVLKDSALAAIKGAGLEPRVEPIRGGTDGAMLSFRGLPCPNLGTGGYNYHGEHEFAVVEEMESAVRVVLNLVNLSRNT